MEVNAQRDAGSMWGGGAAWLRGRPRRVYGRLGLVLVVLRVC